MTLSNSFRTKFLKNETYGHIHNYQPFHLNLCNWGSKLVFHEAILSTTRFILDAKKIDIEALR